MVARRRNPNSAKQNELDQLTAIGASTLDPSDREKLYGDIAKLPDSWQVALKRGATQVDLQALTSLYQLVTGDYEVVEEKFAIKNSEGEVIGTRKVTKPGPNVQAVKLWLERRPTALSSAVVDAERQDLHAESKEQLVSSILALIPSKPD